jgi:hypothetical protein
MTGISQRAYARLRGVALSAVQKAIQTKRITPNADGTLDPELANQEWERNTFAGKTLHLAASPKVAPRSAPPPPSRGGSGMPSSPEVSNDPVAAYLRARAVSETFKAKTAQLEYEERAGKLIQATIAWRRWSPPRKRKRRFTGYSRARRTRSAARWRKPSRTPVTDGSTILDVPGWSGGVVTTTGYLRLAVG